MNGLNTAGFVVFHLEIIFISDLLCLGVPATHTRGIRSRIGLW